MQIPRATYRLQFNAGFRLPDALALVPYFHAIGVSHVYASPLFKATPHSVHGYDVCDFNQLNPEIGTESDLEQLASALHTKSLGLVLDIVPNHMGVASPENMWWWDVLKNGHTSNFAGHFDIDWESSNPGLRGKILVPILGDNYENILAKGELQIQKDNGEFILRYFDKILPLAPNTISSGIALECLNSSPAALDKLIGQQHYRLAFFRDGDNELNYRRFFAVSTLAAIRVEDEKVFSDVHALLRRWLDRGWLDGLRVDHPDGLRDPEKYLQWLRAIAPNAWIVVEKILGPEESLPASWPVQGTTGYDFLNQVSGLFIDSSKEQVLTDFYSEFTGAPIDLAAIGQQQKRLVLNTLFVTEVNRLTELLVKISSHHQGYKSFSREQLREALIELTTSFPVYRTYVSDRRNSVSEADANFIKQAVDQAQKQRSDLAPELFDLLSGLLFRSIVGASEDEFVARFQQLTSPAMAKGIEDTAFYCFNRFVSLNEVGGNPAKFGVSVEEFHGYCCQRQKLRPDSMLASSTHDTKRGEDVRARMNLLSEIPDEWRAAVSRWSKTNERHRWNSYPDRNAEYLYYQTLVGAWPVSFERALDYMKKASRESSQHTTWTDPNVPYERALQNFIAETMRDPEFTSDLEHFIGTLADAAAVNSLAQTLIKLTAPGVPDIYQGTELWDLSLVDPDNRRPVDFALRQRLLRDTKGLTAEEIWTHRAEGLPKLRLIRKALKLRERHPDFSSLFYEPRFAHGPVAENVIAFSRGGKVITLVPRLLSKLTHSWQDTSFGLPTGNWRNEFTGEKFAGEVCLKNLFGKFPVALFSRTEND
jgi:(1->4)-alpha-D-glucan 1-alpha-D-glucosylmutase